MNRRLKAMSCALAVTFSLVVVPTTTKFGPFGVDVVSAATGEAVPATAASTGTTASSSYTSTSISRMLALGSTGNDVKTLQTALNNNGYKLDVDGFFGNLTLASVKDYQKQKGLKVDGVVGPNTLAVLIPAAAIPNTIINVGSTGNDVKFLQTNLNKAGFKLNVDGVFGNLTLEAVKNFQKENGLVVDGMAGPQTFGKLVEKTTTTTPDVAVVGKTTIKIGRAEYAAHGTKCFSVAVVAMAGDKIAAASVDDYQFTAAGGSFTAVPNSDKDFGKNYPAGQILISKRTNAAAYSANMAKSGGATQAWDVNMAGVIKFATGKTVAELEAAIKANKDASGANLDAKVDAVTSATFTDTNGYLSAILAAAKDANNSSSIEIDASQLSSLKLGRAEYAAHGTKCFSVAVALMVGNKIVADSVDDYQFVAPTGYTAVPNSDKDFGKNYPAGLVLASKRSNAATYSANMAKSGGATQTWNTNMAGVEKFAAGKTVAELEAAIKANKDASGANLDAKVDAVTGATFTDTNGYLSAILAAAKDGSGQASISQVSTLKIGRAEYAAHGTKCFSVAVVALAGDKIAAASVDDYQYTATGGSFTAVPNSDKDFGKNYPAGQILISKRTNTAAYSANMAKSGGATQTWDTNMASVIKFATGKTVAELETAIKANKDANGANIDAKVDAVTGATFTDTNGYLSAILAAAKDAEKASAVQIDASLLNSLKMGRAEYAAHGTKCFSVAVAVMAGDKIVADSVDDYQFTATGGSFTAVPNSDKDFGKNYPAGQLLISKRTNAAAYSANMAKSGGATQTWDVNMAGVEKFAAGKTAAELEAAIKANKDANGANIDAKVDAVASATFTDTNGYLSAILAAAKDAAAK